MIFVDSSFWIAEFISRDAHHEQAHELAQAVVSVRLVTSTHVLGETWTYLRRRTDHARAMRWLDAARGRIALTVERIDSGIEDEAWVWLRVHDERPYSFVDATSFALMRKLRITEALAFDGGFASAGFVELRP